MNNQEFKAILFRIQKLEGAVFDLKNKTKTKASKKGYSGAAGGIRLLIDKDYFRVQRQLSEVVKELEKYKYYYLVQVIHNALSRMSKRKGPLNALFKNGKKVYIKRK